MSGANVPIRWCSLHDTWWSTDDTCYQRNGIEAEFIKIGFLAELFDWLSLYMINIDRSSTEDEIFVKKIKSKQHYFMCVIFAWVNISETYFDSFIMFISHTQWWFKKTLPKLNVIVHFILAYARHFYFQFKHIVKHISFICITM